MKTISSSLFTELRRVTSNITMGWKLVRTDGLTLGFTSWSEEFTYDSVVYKPTNAFSGTAAVSKNNLSVDNMSAVVLTSDDITERDLKGGRWDNATVEVFWICPEHPEWGVCPIRGGRIGEIKIKSGQFETELRSVLQRMQQPFGDFYMLECTVQYGDSKCKAIIAAPTWQAATTYTARVHGEGAIGSIVAPTVYNGYWYMCTDAPNAGTLPWGTSQQLGQSGGTVGRYREGLAGLVGAFINGAIQTLDVNMDIATGASGATEPTWPTTLGTTIDDNGLTWTAIYAREVQGTVSGVSGYASFSAVLPMPSGYFKYGVLTWLTGSNAGLKMEVREYIVDAGGGEGMMAFALLEPMPEMIAAGDTFKVVQGCPKTRTFCAGLPTDALVLGADNINNMRAFPDMPTEDKALQTPNFSDHGEPQSSGGKGGIGW